LIGLLFVTAAAVAQEPILDLSIEPSEVSIAPGGGAIVRVIAENPSVREADDLTAYWIGPEGLGFASEPVPIEVIAPFGRSALDLRLAADADLPLGDIEAGVEVVYTYCIDDYCFQIVEEMSFVVRIVGSTPDNNDVAPVAAGPDGLPPAGATVPWAWILFAAALGLTATVLILFRATRERWPAYAAVVLLAGGGLAAGVVLGQHEQAQAIGAVLCTSCVGLEQSQTHEPELSALAVQRLATLESDVELIVFYAVWCHSCPYAEALVEQAAEVNPRIHYRFVDVEVNRPLAEEHGIIRSGRTVVPAVLRVDTGEVLFGAEDLEDRLIDLLGVGE
jgi:thiol-disulfide isomerase/thioredoxin